MLLLLLYIWFAWFTRTIYEFTLVLIPLEHSVSVVRCHRVQCLSQIVQDIHVRCTHAHRIQRLQ